MPLLKRGKSKDEADPPQAPKAALRWEILVGRDPEDLKKYGTKGTGMIAKHFVGERKEAHLTNPILFDLARPHVIGVFGKRGCLTSDTMIFTDHGYKPIQEFDKDRDRVYSYNGGSFEWKGAELVKFSINEPLAKLIFADGQPLIATIEHPLLVFDGKKTVWRQAKDIKEGDFVVCVTQVPEVKGNSESLRIARLLGFILADGTMNIRKGRWKDGRGYWYDGRQSRLRIFCSSDDIAQSAKNDLEKEFKIRVMRYKRTDCNCEVIETRQRKVVEKFKSLGVDLGEKSATVRVPRVVWESSNRFKANFLNALFSCDGSVRKDGQVIEYYSKSRDFLFDLQLLLHHFGVQSRVSYKKARCQGKRFDNYRLTTCDYTSIKNFGKKIGLLDREKAKRLKIRKFYICARRKGTRYLTRNTFCLKVIAVSKVNGVKEVFDLRVPQTNSFIANGIVSHNTGKSYTLGTIAEEFMLLPDEIKSNLSCLIIDTMGIYWSMKSPNDRDFELLRSWELKPRAFDVVVLVPEGQIELFKKKEIPFDGTISLRPADLNLEDWALTFNIDLDSEMGILLSRVIKKLKEETGPRGFSLKDVIVSIKKEKAEAKVKESLSNRFLIAEDWGIFSEKGVSIHDVVVPGRTAIIDVSLLPSWSVRTLIVGLLARRILEERMKARRLEEIEAMAGRAKAYMPITWMLVDEAHQFAPNVGTTPALGPILQWVKIGREPGVSLVMATQQPYKLHPDVLSQCDLLLAHRLTAKQDIDALGAIMQTYLKYNIGEYIDALPRVKGAAIILDDNSERLFAIRMRPRMSWHAGGSPIAIKE